MALHHDPLAGYKCTDSAKHRQVCSSVSSLRKHNRPQLACQAAKPRVQIVTGRQDRHTSLFASASQ